MSMPVGTGPRDKWKRLRELHRLTQLKVGGITHGKWTGAELSAENGRQMLIPAGFLHGFVTREPDTEIIYKCSDYYAPECDGAVRYDCPEIGIDWGLAVAEPFFLRKRRRSP
jgi:dTDP-4-dehydrorhamnose 3,5-epimerase